MGKNIKTSSKRYFQKQIHLDKYREFMRDWEWNGFQDDFGINTYNRLSRFDLLKALKCNFDNKGNISKYYAEFINNYPEWFI
ncbi:hypothetical protein [Leptospira bandrabouensis]|uniref:hypothetical protein n=1 Tax=Leptospira bandrabouensis TaxID=2484903 RepID=UPI001AEFF664|nr:hypothetical protein [Leptospira bandrabouensis]